MDALLPRYSLKKFTELGDPTLLLLGGFGIFFYLCIQPDRRQLSRDCALVLGFCIVLTITCKMAFYLADGPTHITRLRSPSGHVAIATTFYGCCAMLFSCGRRNLVRLLVGIGTAVFVFALAASRVALGLH